MHIEKSKKSSRQNLVRKLVMLREKISHSKGVRNASLLIAVISFVMFIIKSPVAPLGITLLAIGLALTSLVKEKYYKRRYNFEADVG